MLAGEPIERTVAEGRVVQGLTRWSRGSQHLPARRFCSPRRGAPRENRTDDDAHTWESRERMGDERQPMVHMISKGRPRTTEKHMVCTTREGI